MTDKPRFPKMLYREDEQRIVASGEEEEVARTEGWISYEERFAPADEKSRAKKKAE